MGTEHQINTRGFHVDRSFAEAARKIAEAAAPEIEQEIAEITTGDVTSINQVARLMAWLQRARLHHGETGPKTIEKKLLDPELCQKSGGCWSSGSAALRRR